MLVFIVGTIIFLAIDLITKAVFYPRSGFNVIPGILSFEPLDFKNQGAAFGIFQGHVLPLILISIVFITIGGVVYWKFKQGRTSTFYNIGCAFFLGGALGNLYDRIFLGGVRDFLKFDFIDFPIFNFADVFLNIGTVMLVIYVLVIYKGKTKGKLNDSEQN